MINDIKILPVRFCGVLAAVAAWCVLCAPGPAWSQPAETDQAAFSEEPGFRLQGPDRITLGQEASATVVLERPSNRRVKLYTNVGEITQPMDDTSKRSEVTYTPPDKKYPQIAIIAAVSDDGNSFVWTTLQLFGSASVKIETKPHAEVKLRVGTTDYGPAETDKKGIVTMTILVPPGVAQATSFVIDNLGNTSSGSVELGAPAFNRILAVCPPEGHRFLLFAVDEKGLPLRKPGFDLKAFPVTASAVTWLSDGIFTSPIEVPDGIDAGEKVTFIASLTADRASGSTCSMGVPLETATGIKVNVTPDFIVAGGNQPVEVNVEFQYPGKRKSGRVPVALSAAMGTLSEPQIKSDTSYQALWTLPNAFAGKNTASIEARAYAGGRLHGEASIQLRAAPAARVKVTGPDTGLRADGRSTARISAKVWDAYDNPVLSDVHLVGEAKLGSLTAFEKLPDGGYGAVYAAPNRFQTGEDQLVVRVVEGESEGGIRDTCRVGLIPRKRQWSASLRLGYLSNLGRVSSPLFMAAFGFRLPWADQNFVVGAETGYYGSGTTDTSDNLNEKVETSVTAFPLLARVLYQFTFGPVYIYPGLGAGALFAGTEVKSTNTGNSKVVHPYLLLAGFLGASLKAGAGRALIELGYWHSRVDEPWVSGSLGGLHGAAGYELEF